MLVISVLEQWLGDYYPQLQYRREKKFAATITI